MDMEKINATSADQLQIALMATQSLEEKLVFFKDQQDAADKTNVALKIDLQQALQAQEELLSSSMKQQVLYTVLSIQVNVGKK